MERMRERCSSNFSRALKYVSLSVAYPDNTNAGFVPKYVVLNQAVGIIPYQILACIINYLHTFKYKCIKCEESEHNLRGMWRLNGPHLISICVSTASDAIK